MPKIAPKQIRDINETEAKKYEDFVLRLSIFSGILVAIILKADLFKLLNINTIPQNSLGWSTSHWVYVFKNDQPLTLIPKVFKVLIGCFAAGIFISFGSKFWHDLLDIILQIKELRRKLVDEKTYNNVTTIKQLDERIELYSDEIVKGAIEQNYLLLNGDSNDLSCEFILRNGKMDRGILVRAKSPTTLINIPAVVDYTTQLNKFTVYVQTVYVGTAETCATIQIGGEAGNLVGKKINGYGTVGCIIKQKGSDDPMILSCYHVLKSDKHNWERMSILTPSEHQQIIIRENGVDQYVAILEHGYRNDRADIAYAKIINKWLLDKSIFKGMAVPTSYRTVTKDDARNRTRIYFKGKTNQKEKYGFIYSESCPLSNITYAGDPGKWNFKELIAITKLDSQNRLIKVSEKGDSGSIVYDEQTNAALGMVVAQDKAFTYLIPFDRILNDNGLELFKDSFLS
ncbi:hypothetical protein QNI16_27260 [Cytophagaceae bacterium YF14B1]|uniref:Serine protease n=1 Tax=Xanthocytophaga flava TaxID=3048013 RepID=A0AAE3QRN6_9BACT|nr:hypothetical protein [Xanthocytophaga flavus]MDJ1484227.1 hypothetical protein [Xanthocytophaga flavus]